MGAGGLRGRNGPDQQQRSTLDPAGGDGRHRRVRILPRRGLAGHRLRHQHARPAA